jgi:dethiobiotin synthetase
MKNFFITATDTDAGKTFVSCALIEALRHTHKIAAFKPIAAGCDLEGDVLVNEDAKYLFEFANVGQSINDINPIAFAEAIAPHIAAQNINELITVEKISTYFKKLSSTNADISLTEGAGGWRLPLGKYTKTNTGTNRQHSDNAGHSFLSDFVKQQKLEVILVVNMKLGCLNHALLTYELIKADGLNCVAWIANNAGTEEMPYLAENICSLEQLIPVPKIAQLPYFHSKDEQGKHVSFKERVKLAAQQIDISCLFA